MSLETLHKKKQGKVSDKWASYLVLYERIFEGFRGAPQFSMLEIGVQNGGSLETFSII